MEIKALSIRQPWAWLIVNGIKGVENRDWFSTHRGRLLVHASQGMTCREYDECAELLEKIRPTVRLPNFDQLPRGGLVGAVSMIGCTTSHPSPWFFGDYGFIFEDPVAFTLIPCKGRLGIFVPPADALARVPGI